jgi:hypothetical protein
MTFYVGRARKTEVDVTLAPGTRILGMFILPIP